MIDSIYDEKGRREDGTDPVWPENEKEYMKEYIKHQVPFFAGVQDNLILSLVEKLYKVTYPPGHRFARKGEKSEGMYILYSGVVDIFLDPS